MHIHPTPTYCSDSHVLALHTPHFYMAPVLHLLLGLCQSSFPPVFRGGAAAVAVRNDSLGLCLHLQLAAVLVVWIIGHCWTILLLLLCSGQSMPSTGKSQRGHSCQTLNCLRKYWYLYFYTGKVGADVPCPAWGMWTALLPSEVEMDVLLCSIFSSHTRVTVGIRVLFSR